ncbi:methylated-DNA--protein-cysteine methyltransferase-like [Centruroides sculpturatus]|uniref:methylated-DNA--protein-cysteine methyltransferase-like n=1 Tax=Centruroides sculpturatus TaxID=218467 RepID=UPI000C6ECE25|nr:methylated-DNA--protein-cysteine methyltransferase-like [Centruroides sculpturatus]XP_023242341.1 methylated-DNA--protein-cysteine methyltransferase-like [Centruroides sculpturatus]XP_023242342.1 methylated-DNA--protein-cysteine methyltransferase-like [Centruroides sculpturatus]
MDSDSFSDGKCGEKPYQSVGISSPVGEIVVVGCPFGLHWIKQRRRIDDEDFPFTDAPVRVLPGNGKESEWYGPNAQAVAWIRDYFRDPSDSRRRVRPPLCSASLKSTEFTDRVRKTMETIPAGSVVTYGKLAESAGRPRGARAAGGVARSNPFPFLVPCHRVVPKAGGTGEYSGGRAVKRWLLRREGVQTRPEKRPRTRSK